MATSTVIDLAGKARRFTAADGADMCRNVNQARAICRAVAIATEAQIDGSVVYDDPEPSRWGPAIDMACERLNEVRTALTETAEGPNYNWWTPLNLLEALGAAMWHGAGPGHDDQKDHVLDHEELASFMSVAIAALDAVLQEYSAAVAVSNGASND